MSCIVGAIMYCTAVMSIPGPIRPAASYLGNDAWRYAAYYGPPVINQQGISLPGYINPNPIVFPTTGAPFTYGHRPAGYGRS